MELYTAPPAGSTVICADELGPVSSRTFPPAPGWPPGGHRIKAPLEYSRGPGKTWVYGGLRVAGGQEVTMCALSRNSEHYQRFLQQAEDANPRGQIMIITDNLSSHNSKATRAWLEDHPRLRHAFIPKGACWLNLQEGWWRIFRKTALAGQTFADPRVRNIGRTDFCVCGTTSRIFLKPGHTGPREYATVGYATVPVGPARPWSSLFRCIGVRLGLLGRGYRPECGQCGRQISQLLCLPGDLAWDLVRLTLRIRRRPRDQLALPVPTPL